MQRIFQPAISLLNRMGYTKKFTLLWLVSLLAIAVVVYSLLVSLERVILPSQRQLQGLALIEPISRSIQHIQLHRGISAALLGGNEAMKDRRAAQERVTATTVKAMENALPPGLVSNEDFRHIKASWERLRKEGLQWTVAENFSAHTSLIEHIQLFEAFVDDEYLLALGSEIATSYLIDAAITKLPYTLEHLGRIRAYGTGILSRKQITENQRLELKVMISELDNSLKFLNINLNKTGRYNPAVQKSLLVVRDDIADSTQKIIGIVTSDILSGHFSTPPDAFLDIATSEIDKGYRQIYKVLLPAAKTLIEARIVRAENTLYMNIGIALLLFLIAVYISLSICYAIVGSIRSLVHSAHAFASGDLSVRVDLRTSDELNQIGECFNIMADGFSDLLEARKLVEKSLVKEGVKNEMLLRTASDGIHILDLDGNVVQVNDAFCRMLGYTTAEMMAMNVAQWDAQWTAAQIKEKIDSLGNSTSIFETRHRRRDGGIIDVEISVVIVGIDGQKLVYCSSRDITERKQAEKALNEKEHFLSESQRIAHIGSWRYDFPGERLIWSDETYRIYGVSPDAFVLNAESFLNLLHPDDRPEMEAWIEACRAEKMPGDLEFRAIMPDGAVRYLSGRGEVQYDDEHRATHMAGTVQDISERRQAKQMLIESQERLHAVIETALDAVVQMSAEGIITGWNNQAENIFGWTHLEAVGRVLNETIIPPQYRKAHEQGLKRFLRSGEGPILNSRVELVGQHRGGREFPVELSVIPIKTFSEASGKTVEKYEFSAFIRDISRKKESDDLIWKQANYDTLTGLPNRHMFSDRLKQEIKKANRANMKMPLLFIDLDKFKEVNDTLGHSLGDALLVEAAHRINDCVRETDTVARLGGDEFIIILSALDDANHIERVAGNMLRSLAAPFHLGNEVVYVSASIGVTLYPDDATEAEDLLKNADQAMYTAKDKGRNRFSYFTPAMQQAAQVRLRLINELRGALAAGQLRVYFQPVVDMATGRINKAEALIRWLHPEHGMVNPAQFIPLAEEAGLIIEIGDWVFKESVRRLKNWRALGNTDFQVSVNVSPIQFRSSDSLYKTWFAYLNELGLPGHSVVVEITEGLLLDADAEVVGKLLEFRDVGIQIAIDDFGTGYSSLAYLKKFDIDYLKIDQSFVSNLMADSDDMALSEAIIMMSHKLGLEVIAEGVETEEQRKLLANSRCDYAQGYLFSKPVPAEEFEQMLVSGLNKV